MAASKAFPCEVNRDTFMFAAVAAEVGGAFCFRNFQTPKEMPTTTMPPPITTRASTNRTASVLFLLISLTRYSALDVLCAGGIEAVCGVEAESRACAVE